MSGQVQYELQDGVAVLSLNRPGANALVQSTRQDLAEALERAFEDDSAKGVVVCGAGGCFSAGADVAELDRPAIGPLIRDICALIEDAPKPVVTAVHGVAMGAGFELVLAAHGRVAQKGTKVSLPDIALDLVPCGGATQRLPRLIGAQASLEFMLSGRPVDVSDAKFVRVFDAIIDDHPLRAARILVKTLAAGGRWEKSSDQRRGFSDPQVFAKSVAAISGRVKKTNSAENDMVKCIEASQLLPFDQGIAFERARYEDRLNSAESRAIRHLYTAERRADNMPELASGKASEVATVALVGSAPILAELAVLCLNAGQKVLVLAADDAGTEKLMSRVREVYDRMSEAGELDQSDQDERLARLQSIPNESALGQADLVLERGEMPLDQNNLNVKPNVCWVMINLPGVVPPKNFPSRAALQGHIVVLRVQRGVSRAELMELAVPQETSADVVATVRKYFSDQGKVVLRSVEIPGMMGENLTAALMRAAIALTAAGASPFLVDDAARKLGFKSGPFIMMQHEGFARVQARLETLLKARNLRPFEYHALLTDRHNANTGQDVNTHGFYELEGQKLRAHKRELVWLATWRMKQGSVLPKLPDVPLVTALHAAIVNEAARLIDRRALLRPTDIDVAMVRGYGFSRSRGGPLLQADINGLLPLVRAMKQLSELDETLWSCHPLLTRKVQNGERFFN